MAYLRNATISLSPDNTGRRILLPGLVNENNQPVMPMLRYFEYLYGQGRSQSTLAKIREAIRLFYEYSLANKPPKGFGEGDIGRVEHWRHFSRFRQALVHGTCDPQTAYDSSGLYWAGSTVAKGNAVTLWLTDFFTYVDELDGGSDASKFNPTITASVYEMLARASAYEFRRAKSLLGHTWRHAEDTNGKVEAVSKVRGVRSPSGDAPRLTDPQFLRLLEHGFDLRSANGLRDGLIAILMNKGGLRVSEALHLWVIDVCEDPALVEHALVHVRHPEVNGSELFYKGRSFSNRSAYLESVYGLTPRTQLPVGDAMAIGWKAKLDRLRVYWFEPYWGRIFLHLWRQYLKVVASAFCKHPYAFIMKSRDDWRPLTEDAFRKAYEKAVYKAGLVPEGRVDLKAIGLTPHGCRHAYGDRAKNAGGLDEKDVMVILHHASPDSQEVYTRKSNEQLMQALQQGMENLRRSSGIQTPDNAFEPLPQAVQAILSSIK